jgi:hypothetical protein
MKDWAENLAKILDIHEFSSMLVPGAVLLLGIFLIYSSSLRINLNSIDTSSLIIFLIISYGAGHVVQAFGNLVEVYIIEPLFGDLKNKKIDKKNGKENIFKAHKKLNRGIASCLFILLVLGWFNHLLSLSNLFITIVILLVIILEIWYMRRFEKREYNINTKNSLRNYLSWIYFKRILDILTILVIFFAALEFWQMNQQTKIQSDALQENSKVASAQFVYNIQNQSNDPQYDNITSAIEDHDENWPLLTPLGNFTSSDIENYIGIYDSIGNLNNDKLIDMRLAYDEISYDVEKAYCNKDVMRDIEDIRKADNDLTSKNSFYYGFTTLAQDFFKMDHKNCQTLDKE